MSRFAVSNGTNIERNSAFFKTVGQLDCFWLMARKKIKAAQIAQFT